MYVCMYFEVCMYEYVPYKVAIAIEMSQQPRPSGTGNIYHTVQATNFPVNTKCHPTNNVILFRRLVIFDAGLEPPKELRLRHEIKQGVLAFVE